MVSSMSPSSFASYLLLPTSSTLNFMMMRMMMMMNCFCGMVDQQKVFSFISSQDHCDRHSSIYPGKHPGHSLYFATIPELELIIILFSSCSFPQI